MSTANPRNIIHAFGRLCVAPSNLAAAFPHGGTALGMAAEIIFRPVQRVREIRAEEYGGEVVEVLMGREDVYLGATIRGWDSDALQRAFVRTAAGSSSGERVVSYPGSVRAGTLGSDRSVVLLFSPRDTERHPAILIYRAIVTVDESISVPMSQKRELVGQIMARGIRDTSARVYSMGRLEDLSL